MKCDHYLPYAAEVRRSEAVHVGILPGGLLMRLRESTASNDSNDNRDDKSTLRTCMHRQSDLLLPKGTVE